MSEAFNAERLTRLCDFLQQSPTPWHATQRMVERMEQAGFERLEETANWQLSPGKRYYVTRNASSVIAFQLPAGKLTSLRMLTTTSAGGWFGCCMRAAVALRVNSSSVK